MQVFAKILVPLFVSFFSTVVQAWPIKPITLVLPVSPGGGTDVLARSLQERLSKELKQPVVIDYKPGAGGLIALNHVASTPDDHRLLFAPTDVVITALDSDPTFALSDLPVVSTLTRSPLVLATRPNGAYQNFRLVLEKGAGQRISFGSPYLNSVSHLTLEKLLPKFNADSVIINYKGGTPMATDTAGGHHDISISSYGGTFHSWFESGKLVPVLAFTESRMSALPHTPTAKELGIDIVAYTSNSVYGSKNLTSVQLQILNQAFTNAIQEPSIKSSMTNRGNEVMALDVSGSKEWVQQQVQLLLPTLRAVNRRSK